VSLVVQPAPLTVTASNAAKVFDQPNPVFGGTLVGVVNSDNITATFASTATTNSPVGTYPIVPTLVDPNNRLSNYSVVTNDGTLTINPMADIEVIVTAPATVTAGSNLVYTILVTNLGPDTSSNIVLADILPAGVIFEGASGGGNDSGGTVTWPTISSLTNGGSTSFTLTIQVPGSGSITNIAYAVPATFDPNPANNNGSQAQSQAATLIMPAIVLADIAVFNSGPTNVIANQIITYTITVTNLGPATATGVVLTDNFSTNVSFASASTGGTTNGDIVTWTIGSLTIGQTSNVTVTVTAPVSGAFTNIASATSTSSDPNSTNNDGTASAAQVATAITVPQFGILASNATLNPQTGLYEEQVVVTNTSAGTVLGVRLYVDGLPSGVQFYNASGTNAGRPYAQYNSSLNPLQTVTFTLEFYNPRRVAFTNSLDAEAITTPLMYATNSTGSVAITRVFMDTRTTGQPRFVIEFNSVPGNSYTIIYSDDNMVTWKAATPSVTAGANATQWYDDGPPETDSVPGTHGTRFYAIIPNP
jgi:uncharacterized repeat protein (TIGR01451 family)